MSKSKTYKLPTEKGSFLSSAGDKLKRAVTFLWNFLGTAAVVLGILYLAGVKAYESLTTAAANDPTKYVLVGIILALTSAAIVDRFVFLYKFIKNKKK